MMLRVPLLVQDVYGFDYYCMKQQSKSLILKPKYPTTALPLKSGGLDLYTIYMLDSAVQFKLQVFRFPHLLLNMLFSITAPYVYRTRLAQNAVLFK